MQRNVAKSKPKSKLKKGKQPVTVYNRDVICLPSSSSKHGLKSISIPRGNSLIRLAEMGLQGKVTFNSTMNEEEIFSEIRSAFAEPMGQNPSFPFTFLQASGFRLWYKVSCCSIIVQFIPLDNTRSLQIGENMHIYFGRGEVSK